MGTPRGLTTVNRYRIRETLQGNDLSMGASVIALLLTASEDTLRKSRIYKPDFLAVIADLHANADMPISRRRWRRKMSEKLRKSAISAIRTLLEFI